MKIHHIILVTFAVFLVIFLLFGIDKIDANGWSVALGVLIAGIITMLSTILNNVIESQRKEKESIETVRRDAQEASIKLIDKLELQDVKTVQNLSDKFIRLFETIFDSFERKRKS